MRLSRVPGEGRTGPSEVEVKAGWPIQRGDGNYNQQPGEAVKPLETSSRGC